MDVNWISSLLKQRISSKLKTIDSREGSGGNMYITEYKGIPFMPAWEPERSAEIWRRRRYLPPDLHVDLT
jgi:hypothetical protein